MTNRFDQSLTDKVNLRELEVFVSIAETGSISAASHREGLTQPATSQLLRRLETRHRLTLVDRSTRPMKLTPDGNDLLAAARVLLSETRQFVSRFELPSSVRQIDLRIGLVETLTVPFVPRLVEELGPRLGHLSVLVGSTDQQRLAFGERRLDVMIMSDPLDGSGVESSLLLEEPFVLLVPKSRQRDREDLHVLAQELPLIRFGFRSTARATIDAQLNRMRVNVRRDYSIDTPEAVIGMVAAGLGWAVITPFSLIRSWNNIKDVRLLPFPGPRFVRRLYLAVRPQELGVLPEMLTRMSRTILRDNYLPQISAHYPWLKNEILIAGYEVSASTS